MSQCQYNTHLMLCPICCKGIPLIRVVSDKGVISLEIQCNFSKERIYYKLEKYLQDLEEHNCTEKQHELFKTKRTVLTVNNGCAKSA